MCLLFVLVDMGHPDRFLHMVPLIGTPNWPRSMLAWDALVLNTYLLLNLVLVLYLLFKTYRGQPYSHRVFLPLVLLSIPVAISTHTVTAFLYNGMAARPYWNASILAPRFIASAFCSGPAVMIILFQVLRRAFRFEITRRGHLEDRRAHGLRHVPQPVPARRRALQGVLLGHPGPALHALLLAGHRRAPHARPLRLAVAGLQPGRLRALPRPPHAAALPDAQPRLPAHLGGRLHREGDGADHSWFHPLHPGQIYAYPPTAVEWSVAVGVFGIGFLVFTVLVKIAVPILVGTFRAPERGPAEPAHAAGAPTP